MRRGRQCCLCRTTVWGTRNAFGCSQRRSKKIDEEKVLPSGSKDVKSAEHSPLLLVSGRTGTLL